MKNNGTILCVGELLIDFFCTDIDVNLAKGQHFSKQAGGAPANVSSRSQARRKSVILGESRS